MNNRLFSPRNRFLLLAVGALLFASLACSGGDIAAPSIPEATAPILVVQVTPTAQIVAAPTQGLEPTPVVSEPTQPAALAPSILETRRLTLEFPPKMKAGVESDIVILTLEVDDLGNIVPTAQIEGNVVIGDTVTIPDLYDTYNVTAEARLTMAGMLVQPSEATYQPLARGQSAKFIWSIRPQGPGTYRGTVWLHLNFTDRSTGESSRIAVSAQIVEIEAVDFFGLSVNVARTSGVLGSIVGGILGFPFLEDILRFMFKKRKKK